jgi:hypothetical protein
MSQTVIRRSAASKLIGGAATASSLPPRERKAGYDKTIHGIEPPMYQKFFGDGYEEPRPCLKKKIEFCEHHLVAPKVSIPTAIPSSR